MHALRERERERERERQTDRQTDKGSKGERTCLILADLDSASYRGARVCDCVQKVYG